MFISKTVGFHVLNWLGLAIILTTGVFEFKYASGGFLLWGYVVGVLVILISNMRGYLLLALILSSIFILSSFFNSPMDGEVTYVWVKSIYVGFGLGITLLFLLIANARGLLAFREKRQLIEIFLHGTEGIFLTKINGEVVMANPFSEKMLGYNKGELVDNKIENLIPDINTLVKQIGNEESKHNTELVAKRKDGSNFPIEVNIKRYGSGRLDYFVCFFSDITLRKQNEKMLYLKQAELEQANQELEAFTYSVSHDLRTPLRGINGYATMLEEDYNGLLDEEGKRILTGIRKSSEQMGKLIDDLLTFSRLGKKEIGKANVDMTERFNAAMDAINKGIPHSADITFQRLHRAQADPNLIMQVATNLLSNAIKYSSKVAKPKIEISSCENDGEIVYSVQDNGAGFNMKYVSKLFGVFHRLHSNREFEGTGVGLAIVKRIIKKHGGKVWAAGEEGMGATFYFSLPSETRSPGTNTENFETSVIVNS